MATIRSSIGFSGFGQVAATLMVTLSFALFPALGWRSAFLLPAVLPFSLLIALVDAYGSCREPRFRKEF